MLVSHTIDKGLPVLTVVHNLERHILGCHSRQRLRYFVLIALILHGIFHICIRYRIICLCICHLICFCGQRVASACIRKFRNSADIAGKKL